jgi:uncharacterized protein (TIGR03382 family)
MAMEALVTKLNRARTAVLARVAVAALALGMAPAAYASFGERDITYPYTSLGDAGTPLTGVSAVLNGLATVELNGWSFPFAGQTFNEITVSSDGYLAVGNGSASCGCTTGATSDNSCSACPPNPPVSGPFQFQCNPPTYNPCGNVLTNFDPPFGPGLIAPWWEDFALLAGFDDFGDQPPPSTANGTISTLQGGPAGSQYLIVDYSQVGPYTCIFTFIPPDTEGCTFESVPKTFQVQLFESGAIVFTYGAMEGTVENSQGDEGYDENDAIIGVWAPPTVDGGLGWTDAGTMFGPSGTNGNGGCMIATWENFGDFCTPYSNVTNVNSAYIGELDTPFLTSLPVASASATDAGIVVNISLTVNNNGQSAQASGFPVDFFLVPQSLPPYGLPSTCSGSDTCLGSTSFGDAVPAGGNAVYTPSGFSLPSPLPPSGYYAVASVLDPTNTTLNATAPLLETGISTQLLAMGQDLTGRIDLTSFDAGDPTDFTVPLEFTNLGLETADTAVYTLYFVDNGGDKFQVATGNLPAIDGLSTYDLDQPVTIPSGVDAGDYQLELVIGAGTPTDLDLTNNTSLGIQHVEDGQDMTASIVSAPFSIPTPTSFLVPVVFENLGLQPATAIPWTLSLTAADGISTPLGTNHTVSLGGLTNLPDTLHATISQTLPSGAYTLSLMLGPTSVGGTSPATPDLNTSNNLIIDPTPIFVYATTADYAVGPGDLVLDGATHAAAGQIVGVTRTIHNLEGPAGPCPYSYYLNPPGVTQIGNGVPVPIMTKTGATFVGTTPPFAAFGQPGAQNTSTDQIMIPVGMPVGPYELVLALDPDNTVADNNPGNNDVGVEMQLAADMLHITSPSALPAAIVDTPYVYELTETGGGTKLSWSLLAGSLPPGILLSSSGQLVGTPTEPGVFTIVVQLAALGDTQAAVLQLPVASGSGALSIERSSPSLPTAVVGTLYQQQLEAQGGVPPYNWASTITFGMTLNSSGLLYGTPEQPTDGPVQFTVNVTDSIGTVASYTFSILIIAPGTLAITTPYLQTAVVGTSYDQPILATDGTIVGVSYNWSLSSDTPLPSGLTFQQLGSPAVAVLSGSPTQAGNFPVVLNLADNFGHNATRQYILTVADAPIPVPQQTLPVAVIGESYSAQLQAISLSTVSWRIFSGALPPGLTLSPVGSISGTVASATVSGAYSFSVAVSDLAGAESVVPLAIQVEVAAPPSGGCATGSGPLGAGLLLLALSWLGARRRNRQGTSLDR